jgi:hypothetical protein
MDIANQENGIVVGTGDLSELALGWATYNGDHMSMYGVNASVPKTLVRYIVSHEADRAAPALAAVLRTFWPPRVAGAAARRRRRRHQPEDRGSGGALRAARLFPVLFSALRLLPRQDLPAGKIRLRRRLRRTRPY